MKKTSKKTCPCGTANKTQMDMILFEIRQNRKDISELKDFMQKSKGTLAVILFLAGIIAAFVGAWNYIK
jgi:hypothetical protein